jgi:biotin carboxyl carrier protein
MKRYEITIEGHIFDVAVLSDPQQAQVDVEVDGEILTVEVRSPAPGSLPAPAESAPPVSTNTPPAVAMSAAPPAAATSGSLVAPLPGVVKRVMVEPGQAIEPGQALLVIEAMKMDNVIRASRAGVVGAIHTAEGRQVAHGDALLDLGG